MKKRRHDKLALLLLLVAAALVGWFSAHRGSQDPPKSVARPPSPKPEVGRKDAGARPGRTQSPEPAAQPGKAAPTQADATAIYDLCLRDIAGERPLSECFLKGDSCVLYESDWDAHLLRMGRYGIDASLQDSYFRATATSSPIPRSIEIDEITRAELKRIWGTSDPHWKTPDDFWDNLHRNRPGKRAILMASAIGFDADGTTAMVYCRIESGPLAGHGVAYLLRKNGGGWTIFKRVGMDVS